MLRSHKNIFDSLLQKISLTDKTFETMFELLIKYGENRCFIAGGAIRDTFLNVAKSPKDLDLFIKRNAYSAILPWLKENGNLILNPFGSPRWFPKETKDFYYDIIIIEDFYNGLWRCETITDVLCQFDFTANAIAFDLVADSFYNPLNGLEHLERRELRAVRFDYPEMNISNEISLSRNSVLWFRYQYYANKLKFNIEPITMTWINNNKHRESEKSQFVKYFFNPDKI